MTKLKAPKAVLFDMDGVLINSMPMHVQAWTKLYNKYDIKTTEEYLYSEEGRVGKKAIAKLFLEQKNRILTDEEMDSIYNEKKVDVMNNYPRPPRMEGMLEFVKIVKASGCAVSIVTGSGQSTLLNIIDEYYPGCFDASQMVTASDVKHGKPQPEPYLMGAQKHGVAPQDAFVVENAPLGTTAGKAAGCFVLGLNSGKLTDELLYENGADIVVKTAAQLCEWWKNNVI